MLFGTQAKALLGVVRERLEVGYSLLSQWRGHGLGKQLVEEEKHSYNTHIVAEGTQSHKLKD